MKKLIIILILIGLALASPAHASFDGFKMEDGSGYILMEDGGYILMETSTASAPTGINPARLFIILDD